MSGTPELRNVVVATTFEHHSHYPAETEILFRTLAAYGGTLADARRVACSVGAPDPFVVEVLADLDVEVVQVAPFDARCPHANKLAMLEQVEPHEYLFALDTDVAFAGDPSQWLDTGAVAAKPVDADPIGLDQWPALFEARGIELPPERYRTDFHAADTIPYFNSGVLGIPGRDASLLHHAWAGHVRWLLDHIDELPPVFAARRFFIDQMALALALAELRLPVQALPVEANFPTHHPLHASLDPDSVQPVLLHHHHRLTDQGELLPTVHAGANAAIARVNEELRREPDAEPLAARAGQRVFDNEAFWDERYATDPSLGSGIGSRGEHAAHKAAILQTILDADRPASILDVGCGDLEIVSRLRTDAAYTGVDISGVVVARNRERFPDWRFLHGEFSELRAADDELRGDLVLCLDVLIHQHDPEHHRALVRELVAATNKVGVIAAYDEPPSGANASAITAYHGPITELLRELGAQDVEVVDSYRGTAVVRYRTAHGAALHPRHVTSATLAELLPKHPSHARFDALVACALETTGFYPDHAPRVWEYPVVADLLLAGVPAGGRIADVGAGVAPLAPYLTRQGFKVDTIDPSPHRRRWPSQPDWNEWDFLDYAEVGLAEASWNTTLDAIPTDRTFEGICSVSVIEHLPAEVRRALLRECHLRLEPGGLLVLTVDVVRDAHALWNHNRGTMVEDPAVHGSFDDISGELLGLGFDVERAQIVRDWGSTPVDIGLLVARRD